jgi:hypothetical protein
MMRLIRAGGLASLLAIASLSALACANSEQSNDVAAEASSTAAPAESMAGAESSAMTTSGTYAEGDTITYTLSGLN